MLRPKHTSINPIKDNIIINTIDWTSYDEKIEIENDSDSDIDMYDDENNYKQKYNKEFIIKGYGVTDNGNSININIKGFKPYFYVKLPEQKWNNIEFNNFINFIQSKLNYYEKDNILLNECKIEEKIEFYGFTNNKLLKYGKLVFKNISGFYSVMKILTNDNKIFKYKNLKLKMNKLIYETNITPLLRFFHIKNIKPVGWIKINKKTYKISENKSSRCNFEIDVNYDDINPINLNKIGKILIASFDIECTSLDGTFPKSNRKEDEIIQIGTSIYEQGNNECIYKHMVTLKNCDKIDGMDIESYNTEEEVIMAWVNFIERMDPDILTGYNIWGFDEKYIYDRIKNGCGGKYKDFSQKFLRKLSRNKNRPTKYNEDGHRLSSSAMGDNLLYYFEIEGIVQIDLLKVIQKDYKLELYKLDYISEYFLKNKKIDLSPEQIFKNYSIGTSDKIKEIAAYCIKDCFLVNDLINKLNIITNNVGMGNVCIVPLSFLFTRGQGIKIFSLVAKQCREDNFIIKKLNKEDIDTNGYEGAIVFDPEPGIYFDPVAVMDYASLYPSSMIAENISHDSIVGYKTFQLQKDNTFNCIEDKINYNYIDLKDYNYTNIEYDLFSGIGDDKKKIGYKVCTFAEHKNGSKSILPRILQNLLKARKDTRKIMTYVEITTLDNKKYSGLYEEKNDNIILKTIENDCYIINKNNIKSKKDLYNDFEKAVLDGQQLAYKITCNSVYGQVGATTSSICFKELAASTTATGRKMVLTARDITLDHFKGSKLVYGDTDSIFINFVDYIKSKYGDNLSKTELLEKTIEVGKEAGALVTSYLKKPQDLEYEKTFYPFIIFSKKRYVGNKYEYDSIKFKQTSMGIVLKRRDNAPILKHIYGGIIDTILNKSNIEDAKKYYINEVDKLLKGDVDIDKLIVTKSIKNNYANPTVIPHKVLADKIAERDPGNKPQSNDRIQYCFINHCCLKCSFPNCNANINSDNCKCRSCMKLFCSYHLNNHKKNCVKICRFCKKKSDQCELIKCNTCHGIYCVNYNSDGTINDNCCLFKHNIKKDKFKNISHDKCKKLLDTKLIQGDFIEQPDYIKNNNLIIDYKYYFDKQIKNPVEQIFSLIMDKPEKLTADLLRKDINYKQRNSEITDFFKIIKK